MKAHTRFENARQFATYLRGLHQDRDNAKREVRLQNRKRRPLTPGERQSVFAKTAGRCHVCGGVIASDEPWDADHVSAHAQGGAHSVDNYLPAHSICNNHRWYYSAQEIQWILKLGVWLRTKIEREDKLALELAERFVRYEANRESRRKA